jgi:hypothetical protein
MAITDIEQLLAEISALCYSNDEDSEHLARATNLEYRASNEAKEYGETKHTLGDVIMAINELNLAVRAVGAVIARQLAGSELLEEEK